MSEDHPGEERRRARELGISLDGEPGPWNAITDVPGVEVGYVTLVEGDDVRTGVTALLPRGRDGVGTPCAAGWHSFNGNGEMTGTAWIEESGSLAVPVVITNTYAVGPVHRGVVEWVRANCRGMAPEWLLPVVTETWDGHLNDIHGTAVESRHAAAAIGAAASGPVEEGCVGGGTGMRCYGFKGGSGTASRVVEYGEDRYTVGAFVQANFGARRELVVAGVPVGRELTDPAGAPPPEPVPEGERPVPPGAGSVIVVVATDAPLLPGQCKALARRVTLGLARTGTTGSHFSGDLFLAFSTANPSALTSTFPEDDGSAPYESMRFVPWGRMDPFYGAVVESVEEAVLNVLTGAHAMTGRAGHHVPALPLDRVAELLAARGALS
ncbi:MULTISPECIES: P1 family peptidase [unclassified Streptomyces]|uniref:DmpA family aminopeptidase n=1 Tax=unclassified Streptomyces TaxID=2593676 RepID=UPI002E762980|nr:P1 family peptidase [Streptomyces sp. JV190]MEE1845242.1 P1 family peptidase [Streptomyces sp. JV190]